MTVRFELTRDDYRRLLRFVLTRYPPYRRIVIGVLVAALAVITLLPVPGHPDLNVFVRLLIGLTTVALATVLALYLSCRLLAAIPTEGSGVLGYHSITISTEGIRESTAVNEGLHRWEGVTDCSEDRDLLYLVIGRSLVHAIPKRAFDTAGEAMAFLDLARELQRASQSNAVA
jgi:hypothetical protein